MNSDRGGQQKGRVSPWLRYPRIFWDAPDIAGASPEELRGMLKKWRSSNSPVDKLRLKGFIRRIVERGTMLDAYKFLLPEEARAFFEDETAWFIDWRLDDLWRDFAGLPKDFPLRKGRDGRRKSSGSCW
jgi:hypothetical protein